MARSAGIANHPMALETDQQPAGNVELSYCDPREKQTGLTLLELMVTLAIVAVLTSIAVPNYQFYIKRTRRADAMISLQRLANEQEQFYFDNNRYSNSLASINLNSTSPDGYYTLSLASISNTFFIGRAIPVAASTQAGAGRFEIRSTGQKSWDPGEDGVYECEWGDALRGNDKC